QSHYHPSELASALGTFAMTWRCSIINLVFNRYFRVVCQGRLMPQSRSKNDSFHTVILVASGLLNPMPQLLSKPNVGDAGLEP
ncbi:MAG: hypothetical protein V3R87_11360, partial [Dehalococcoidia bacterium]